MQSSSVRNEKVKGLEFIKMKSDPFQKMVNKVHLI